MAKAKLGILTFHEAINYGAFFQVYALQTVLKSLGHQVCILNYRNRHHHISEQRTLLSSRNPLTLLSNLKKIMNFRYDQRQLLIYPPKPLTKEKQFEEISRDIDITIYGSDIIWDCEMQMLGCDPIYFGAHNFSKYGKISYAPSMGTAQGLLPMHLSRHITDFQKISVRDEKTRNLVSKSIAKSDISVVVDPTILLAPRKWSELVGQRKIKEKYLLIYCTHIPGSVKSQITEFAEKRGLKVILVGFKQRMRGIKKISVGPFDWLNLFAHADYVVTSTFHGTVFSVIFKKKFLVFRNLAIDAKAPHFLEKIGLLDSKYLDAEKQDINIDKCLEEVLDYQRINKTLSHLREKSRVFLEEAIEETLVE
jgi:hypothetical protein